MIRGSDEALPANSGGNESSVVSAVQVVVDNQKEEIPFTQNYQFKNTQSKERGRESNRTPWEGE